MSGHPEDAMAYADQLHRDCAAIADELAGIREATERLADLLDALGLVDRLMAALSAATTERDIADERHANALNTSISERERAEALAAQLQQVGALIFREDRP